MFDIKKIVTTTLVMTTLVTGSAMSAFAADNNTAKTETPTVHTQPSSSSVVQDKPVSATSSMTIKDNVKNGGKNGLSDTTYGNGGSATISLMESDKSFAWSIKPNWFGPYTYRVYVRITDQTGKYITQSKFAGLSIGGTHSDVTGSYAYLPAGSYWATLIGDCIFDPGTAEIGDPTIPFYIF